MSAADARIQLLSGSTLAARARARADGAPPAQTGGLAGGLSAFINWKKKPESASACCCAGQVPHARAVRPRSQHAARAPVHVVVDGDGREGQVHRQRVRQREQQRPQPAAKVGAHVPARHERALARSSMRPRPPQGGCAAARRAGRLAAAHLRESRMASIISSAMECAPMACRMIALPRKKPCAC